MDPSYEDAATGSALTDLATRVSPVLVFLVAITVWLANTASLLLPVSNLTNLLALHRFSALGLGHKGYISLALWPALAAIAATVCVLAVIHLRDLRGRYSPEAPPAPHDRTLLIVAASVCAALGPAFASGITPAIPATAAALVLVGACLVRNRPLLRAVKVPWLIVIGVCVLFIAVDIALDFAWQGAVCAVTATIAAALTLALA